MKKVISLLLSIAMLFSITVGLDLSAYAQTNGDFEYEILDGGTAEITGYTGSAAVLTIPSTLDGYAVEAIGVDAFYGNRNLKKVVISNGIKKIGYDAFNECYNLSSISIPESVTSIKEGAFKYTGYYYNESNWENDALYLDDCLLYTRSRISPQLIVKDGTRLIGETAFNCCGDLKTIVFPDSLSTIPRLAIFWCGVENIIIPKSITEIEYNAICQCDYLENIFYAGSEQEFNNICVDFYEYADSDQYYNELNNRLKSCVRYNSSCAKNQHDAVISSAVSPTCTKAGKTEGSYCSICKLILTEQKNISAKGHTYKTTTTKATTSKNGSIVNKCSVCGAVKSKSTVYYPKTITLSATSYTYDGKVKKPSVKVVGSNGKTISSSNYTVTYSSGRKNVGKYTVTIKFKGNYSGTVKKTFTIKPKNTSISKITAKSKGFTVKWKKYTTQTTGYQIQYSTSSKFTSGTTKTVTVSKNSTTSKTVSKLKSKKKYYVRIRTYKTVSGTKYYSSWSKAKTVTTKK